MGGERRNWQQQKLPVKADMPKYLWVGTAPAASVLDMTVGDLVLMAFYFLLQVGKNTFKSYQNNSKQTVQFKLEDVTSFVTVRADSSNSRVMCWMRRS